MRVAGCVTGRKCVGRVGWNDIHLRHRDADLLCQALDDLVSARQFFTRDRLRSIHSQSDLVTVEIRNEIHDDGHAEGHLHTTLSAEDLSHKQQKKRQCGQQ